MQECWVWSQKPCLKKKGVSRSYERKINTKLLSLSTSHWTLELPKESSRPTHPVGRGLKS